MVVSDKISSKYFILYIVQSNFKTKCYIFWLLSLANSNSRLWIKSNAWTESIEDKKVLIKDEITNPIVKFQLRFLYFSLFLCLSILKLTYEYRSWYHFLVQIPFGYWPILALYYILNHTKEMPYKKKLDPV